MTTDTTEMVGSIIEYGEIDLTTTYKGIRGGYWFSGITFSCGPATQVQIQGAVTSKGG